MVLILCLSTSHKSRFHSTPVYSKLFIQKSENKYQQSRSMWFITCTELKLSSFQKYDLNIEWQNGFGYLCKSQKLWVHSEKSLRILVLYQKYFNSKCDIPVLTEYLDVIGTVSVSLFHCLLFVLEFFFAIQILTLLFDSPTQLNTTSP